MNKIRNAMYTLRAASLREIVEALRFYDEHTPEKEWDEVLYEETIADNSYIFAFLSERAIQCGEFRSECSILEEDGITVIYDHIINDARVYIDDNEIQLNGRIISDEEE